MLLWFSFRHPISRRRGCKRFELVHRLHNSTRSLSHLGSLGWLNIQNAKFDILHLSTYADTYRQNSVHVLSEFIQIIIAHSTVVREHNAFSYHFKRINHYIHRRAPAKIFEAARELIFQWEATPVWEPSFFRHLVECWCGVSSRKTMKKWQSETEIFS